MNSVNASTIILPASTDDVAGTIVLPRRRFGANRGLVIAIVVILTLVILAATGVGIFFVVRAVQKRKRDRRAKAEAAAAAAAAANTSTAPQSESVGENVTSTAPANNEKICDHKKSQPGWEYTVRDLKGGTWGCPQGYEENGCDWVDGKVAGRLQCRRRAKGQQQQQQPAPREPPPRPMQEPAQPEKCDHKTPQDGYEYTTRVDGGGGAWKCPKGYDENGCSWGDGDVAGFLQCRRKTKPTKPPRTPKPVKCDHKTQKAGWEYTTRVDGGGGTWKCPKGYDDNGCSWGDGEAGRLQCRRKDQAALGPLKTLKKGVQPYNVLSISNDSQVSVADGGVKITYSKGKIGIESGGAVHFNPFKKLPTDSCAMSYSAYFPAGFEWNKGGKLPGVCLGADLRDCATGGRWSMVGGSARLMFKEGGSVIGYLYMPYGSPAKALDKQSDAVKQDVTITGGAGMGVWSRGSPFKLRAGEWNSISVAVVLNSPGAADGSFSVSVNGVSRAVTGIRWRDSAALKISSMNIVSFFGGGSMDWAAPASSTHVIFKDFRFS